MKTDFLDTSFCYFILFCWWENSRYVGISIMPTFFEYLKIRVVPTFSDYTNMIKNELARFQLLTVTTAAATVTTVLVAKLLK